MTHPHHYGYYVVRDDDTPRAPSMEALLRRELVTSRVIALGRSGGGCISEGQSYETDNGRVFVKHNSDQKVRTNLSIFLLVILGYEPCNRHEISN